MRRVASSVITHDGTLYISEPGEHSDEPSQIWQIKSTSEKKVVDQGLSSASGVALSTDGSLFFPVRSLCFGGVHFDILDATDGRQIFNRQLKVTGFAPWAAPISAPSQGAG